MKIMYIAAPFRGPNGVAIAFNVAQAQLLGMLAVAGGYMPLIPQANTAVFHGYGPDQFYLDGTMELLRRCDALLWSSELRVSQGVKDEILEAERLNIPIYRYNGKTLLGGFRQSCSEELEVGALEHIKPFTFPSFSVIQ